MFLISLVLTVLLQLISISADKQCQPVFVRWPRVKLNLPPKVKGPYSLRTCRTACSHDENPTRVGAEQQCSAFNHRVGPTDYHNECHVYEASAVQRTDGLIEADDRFSFYWKYCLNTNRSCGGDYGFTFLSDRYISQEYVSLTKKVPSLEDCLSECLNQGEFMCRSLAFNRTSHTCYISQHNQLSKPSMVKINNNPNYRIDYYENSCFNTSDTFSFSYTCEEEGIRVKVESKFPYTGALYGLYDFFTCRVEPKEEKNFELLFPYPTKARNCSDSIRYKGDEMILEVVLSTDGVEPLYFITSDDLTYQARCPIDPKKSDVTTTAASNVNDNVHSILSALADAERQGTFLAKSQKVRVGTSRERGTTHGLEAFNPSKDDIEQRFESTTKDVFPLPLLTVQTSNKPMEIVTYTVAPTTTTSTTSTSSTSTTTASTTTTSSTSSTSSTPTSTSAQTTTSVEIVNTTSSTTTNLPLSSIEVVTIQANSLQDVSELRDNRVTKSMEKIDPRELGADQKQDFKFSTHITFPTSSKISVSTGSSKERTVPYTTTSSTTTTTKPSVKITTASTTTSSTTSSTTTTTPLPSTTTGLKKTEPIPPSPTDKATAEETVVGPPGSNRPKKAEEAVVFDIYNNGHPVDAVVSGSRITLSFTPYYAIPPAYMTVTGCQVESIEPLNEWEKEPFPILKDGCQADHFNLVCPPIHTDYGVRVTMESFRLQTTAQVQYTCLVRICPFSPCPQTTCSQVEGCPREDLLSHSLGLRRRKRNLTLEQIRAALAANPLLQQQLALSSQTSPMSNTLHQQLITIGGDHIVRKKLIVLNSEEELEYYVKTGELPEHHG